MINPDCPHVVPSLDHPDGEYCPKCNGGPCQLSESEALADLVDRECELQVYKPDTSPETIEQGLREGWIVPKGGNCHNPTAEDTKQCATQKNLDLPGVSEDVRQELQLAPPAPELQLARSELSHSMDEDKPSFEPGSKVWLEMQYYGKTTWAEFEIVPDTTTLGEYYATTHCDTGSAVVVDTLVVNEWFKSRARKKPPKSVSDSHLNQGFEGFVRSLNEKFSDSHSDSLKPRRSSECWQEGGRYRSKGRVYYRCRWGKGRKIEGVAHIPGGAMTSDLVRNRAYRVYKAVEVEKRPHTEVIELIRNWGRNRRKSQA